MLLVICHSYWQLLEMFGSKYFRLHFLSWQSFCVMFIVWDKKMVYTQFNWCWYHVPTFAPYKVEGVFFPLILASGGNAQTTKTALVVLQSLTPNAQSVFKILAEYQLANEKEEGKYSNFYTMPQF